MIQYQYRHKLPPSFLGEFMPFSYVVYMYVSFRGRLGEVIKQENCIKRDSKASDNWKLSHLKLNI